MYLAHSSDFDKNPVRPSLHYHDNIAIVKHNGTFSKITNVCPHQGARICSQPSDHLSCPYHGMKWELDGEPLNNDYVLEPERLPSCGDFIFDVPTDINHVPLVDRKYELVNERTDIVKASYITIMDVFLDIDHIPHAHQGVYDRILITASEVEKIDFTYESWGSVQVVSKDKETLAVWLAVYPNAMIELQPSSMIITQTFKEKNNHNHSRVLVQQYKVSDAVEQDYLDDITMWETAWQQDVKLSESIVQHIAGNLEYSKKHYRRYLELNGLSA